MKGGCIIPGGIVPEVINRKNEMSMKLLNMFVTLLTQSHRGLSGEVNQAPLRKYTLDKLCISINHPPSRE